MSSEQAEEAGEVDYQIGAYSVDTGSVDLGDETGELMEFELETSAVFKRLADDIYESEEAGIREPMTNAVTAILRAQSEGYIDESGVIRIVLKRGEDGDLRLVLEDNGIGISEAELDEVVRVIGRSTVRDAAELAGQFGMGFLAVFKLVGMDGGFVMHSNSRKPGTEPVSGVWKSSGFTKDTDGRLPGGFADDEYGTRFEFILKDEIEADKLFTWVKKNAQFARVPVMYEELDPDEKEIRTEEFGCTPIPTLYDETDPYVSFETEYFTAHMSPAADKRTILLDVPIKRNQYSIRTCPWKVDIRLKCENSIVVKGPHEGLMPVPDGEYTQIDSDRRDKYVSKSDLTQDDIVLPGPVGTRDQLASNRSFWSWLGEQLKEQYKQRGQDILASLTQPEDVLALGDAELDVLLDALDDVDEEPDAFDVRTQLQSAFGESVDETIASFLAALLTPVSVLPPNSIVGYTDDYEQDVTAFDVQKGVPDCVDADGEVYMGCSLNQLRADVVWEDSDTATVVKLPSADLYEPLEDILGWTKLRSVTRATIDEYDVSDSLQSEFMSEMGKSKSTNPAQQNLTLRFGEDSTTETETAHRVAEKFQTYASDGVVPSFGRQKRPSRLILFPDSGEENVSNYYWMASSSVAIARCSDDVREYLQRRVYDESVQTFQEYQQAAEQMWVTTSDGDQRVGRLDSESILFHVVADEAVETFRSEDVLSKALQYLHQESKQRSFDWEQTVSPETNTYVPLTREELDRVRCLLTDATVVTGDEGYEAPGDDGAIRSDTALYAYARLEPLTAAQPPELEYLLSSSGTFTNGGYELVETLVDAEDWGVYPNRE